MFKSVRKGGKIVAVAIGIVAALTPLAAPPAALADGLPTPELEKTLTVDVEGQDSNAWFTDDGNYAIISDYDYDLDDNDNGNYVHYGYSRLDFKSGEVTPIDIPKSCLSDVCSTSNGKYLYWLEDDKVIVYSVEDQQRVAHSIQVKKSEVNRIELNEDGNSLTAYCSNGKYGDFCVFNLQSNEKSFTYKFEKDDLDAVLSRNGKRLYVCSNRKLKIIDIPDGSTSIKEIPGNAQCDGVTTADGSDKLLLIETTSDDDDSLYTTYFMADYDGNNIDKVADGHKIHIYGWGNNILALTGENFDTIVIDSHSGKQIRYVIRNDDEDSYDSISDISRNGDIALARVSHDNSSAIRLIDTKTGQRVDCKIKTDDYYYPEFVDNDQKILVDYSDAEDPTKLHIDVYKSNIHYSPIEKLIFFAQDNMPIVVGGGIAAVLMIIGGIAGVCIRRKKRAAAQTSIAGTAPKAKKHKRSRHKKHAQQEQVAQQSSADSAFDTQWQSSGEPLTVMPQQPVASSTPKFCRHCGTPLVPEAKFCPKCGHPVE